MAVSLSAAAVTSPLPSVDVTVSGLTVASGSTLSVTRSWAGLRAPVRAASAIPVTGASMIVTDYEAPFGVTTSYSVEVLDSDGSVSAQASSSAVTLAVTSVWLSDPLSPRAACAVSLSDGALTQVDDPQDVDVLAVMGASFPVGLTGQRRTGGSFPMEINLLTVAARVKVAAVFASAGVILVRVPAGDQYSWLPALAYMVCPTVSGLRLGSSGAVSKVSWSGSLVRAPGATVVVPPRTYADLTAEASTYADLASLYSSYLSALRGG